MANPFENKQQETEQKDTHELMEAADKARQILIKADSIFPFMLFPDSIAVSRMKVTVTKRQFFRVAEVISLPIDDILNVEADLGPFFGSLSIYTRFFVDKPLRITFISRKNAADIKKVLEGFIIAHKQNVDLDHLEKHELMTLLMRLDSDPSLR